MKVNIYLKTNLRSWVFPSFNAIKVNICLKVNLHSWIFSFTDSVTESAKRRNCSYVKNLLGFFRWKSFLILDNVFEKTLSFMEGSQYLHENLHRKLI